MFFAFMGAELTLSFLMNILAINSSFQAATVISLVVITAIFTIIASIFLPQVFDVVIARLTSPELKEIYQQVFLPYQNQLFLVFILAIIDIIILISSLQEWLNFFELIFGLSIAITISWLGSRIFRQFFVKFHTSMKPGANGMSCMVNEQ